MNAAKEGDGGCAPHTKKLKNQLNDRSKTCRKCEVTRFDRNYSLKTGLIKTTSPVFVTKGGN